MSAPIECARARGRARRARAACAAAVGIGLGLLACAAGAQAPAPERAPAVLTLRHAVSEAVLRHPAGARAAHEVAAAGFERDAAEWGRFPTLSVDAGPRISGDRLPGTPTTVLRLEQPIWAGGRIDAQIDAARSQVSAADFAETETRQRIAERAAVAYVVWVHALERVEIARTGAELLVGLVRYVRRREAEGVASSADVAIASARHGSVVALLASLRGALDRARAELEAVTLMTGFERGVPVSVPAYPERALAEIELAYVERSPFVAQRRAEVEAARAQVTVRRAQLLPRLAVRLERLSGLGAGIGGGDESRASLVLQLVPEPGLASYSGAQAAASRVDAARAQLESEENDLGLRARTQWAEYAAARAQVGEIEPQVAALEAAASSFMRQFEVGRKSWLDVLNTHREAIDARLALSQARTARDQSALRLMVNSGTFWPWLETLPR